MTSRTFNDAFDDLIRHGSQIPDEKGVRNKKFESSYQTLSPPEGRGWLGTRLGLAIQVQKVVSTAHIPGGSKFIQ